ncbi:MAG: Smr/MutS family protein [Hyphomicrobiaceae bacterium]
MKRRRTPAESAGSDESPPRRSPLTTEDEALWRAVTETIKPIAKRIAPVTREPRAPTATISAKALATSAAPVRPSSPPVSASRKTPPRPPAATTFEVKRAKRLRRGVLDIEARIDLHGMRQAEAHRALRHFLMSSQARGLKHVKVITGKGRGEDSDARHFELHPPERPGILKRMVPVWLGEPDLAAVVVSFTSAGRQHGGEGALYVHLRRRKPESG